MKILIINYPQMLEMFFKTQIFIYKYKTIKALQALFNILLFPIGKIQNRPITLGWCIISFQEFLFCIAYTKQWSIDMIILTFKWRRTLYIFKQSNLKINTTSLPFPVTISCGFWASGPSSLLSFRIHIIWKSCLKRK